MLIQKKIQHTTIKCVLHACLCIHHLKVHATHMIISFYVLVNILCVYLALHYFIRTNQLGFYCLFFLVVIIDI